MIKTQPSLDARDSLSALICKRWTGTSLTPSLWSLGDGVKSALSECSLMGTQGSVGSTPLEEAVHAAQHLESHFSVLYVTMCQPPGLAIRAGRMLRGP